VTRAIGWTASLLFAAWCGVADAAPAQSAQQPSPTTGRVVATITALEGTVHMPGMDVELRDPTQRIVIAKTVTDGAGQVTFPDIPEGRYVISVSRPGFVARDSPVFTVKAGETSQVLLDTKLAFVQQEVLVRANPSPTDSVQPVSASDMLSGTIFETAPLEGDDFRSLLPLLPGVVRDANGRLQIRGGQPTQGALQISAASLIDPSSGEFDVDLPAQSIESVEVLANPFAAEYGRFTTSITEIRTRSGTNEWDLSYGNFIPKFRGFFTGIKGFEPRFSIRGPLKRDKTFFAQDVQFRYVATPVKSLPDEPEVKLRSFDSFTRVDTILSPRHTLSGALILFPRKLEHVTMNTFRPEPTTPDQTQAGYSAGVVDRFSIWSDLVVETTVSFRQFEVEVNATDRTPMVYAPQTQSGSFFNDQERNVDSIQWVEALTLSRNMRGEHVFKFGFDLQRSNYDGNSFSRPVEVRRLDGSLAERTEFGGESQQAVVSPEFAMFAQDRWRVNSRLTFEFGLRFDRDGISDRVNWSPRAGAAYSVLPEGRAIVRGGYGKFAQRTPLNVDAFTTFESRTVTRFASDGAVIGGPLTYTNALAGELKTPEANVGNIEWDQRFGRRYLFKIGFLGRRGSHEYIVNPDPVAGRLFLSSTGKSQYRELEVTTRYLGGERKDLTLSYVWAKGTADLNNYDQFFGNFRNPIIRPNENNLTPTDVRHRLLLRGTVGLPWQIDMSPVLELRSGFPWSAVNEFQDFVGPRSRAGRLPTVRTLDMTLVRPWHFRKYNFRAGLKLYNLFGASAERDIQNNITSPFYGTAYNPVERSIGFVFGSGK
jgi:hypothetical protein